MVIMQASAPVSTFKLMLWFSLIMTLAYILSGWLLRALSAFLEFAAPLFEVKDPSNTAMGSVLLISSSYV